MAGAFPPSGCALEKRATTVTVVIPTKECADTIGRRSHAHRGSAARRRRGRRACWSSTRIRPTEPPRSPAPAGATRDRAGRGAGRATGRRSARATRCGERSTSDRRRHRLLSRRRHGGPGSPAPAGTDRAVADRSVAPARQGSVRSPAAEPAASPLPNEGGRVTELMARPLLNLHEPRLAGFAQPLAGEFAGRRELLESIPFPVGYGVEIAVLIDALRRHGLDALAECHLGAAPEPPSAAARPRRDGLCGACRGGEADRRWPQPGRRPLPPAVGRLRGIPRWRSSSGRRWTRSARARTELPRRKGYWTLATRLGNSPSAASRPGTVPIGGSVGSGSSRSGLSRIKSTAPSGRRRVTHLATPAADGSRLLQRTARTPDREENDDRDDPDAGPPHAERSDAPIRPAREGVISDAGQAPRRPRPTTTRVW